MSERPGFLTPFRLRLLSYLEQRGPTHRSIAVPDLSPADSKMASRHCRGNGARLMGAWCKPLVDAGLVRVNHDEEGWYRSHSITEHGAKELRRWT